MKILLLTLLPLMAFSQDNSKKGFEPNAKHTGPVQTGKEGKPSPYTNPNNQWGPSQSYPNLFPQHRQQDNCIIS